MRTGKGLVAASNLVMNCEAMVFRDQASDHVANHDSAHSSVGFLQRCHLPHSQHCKNFFGDVSLGKRLPLRRTCCCPPRSLSKNGRKCSVLMPDAPCCSTTCRPEIVQKLFFVQLEKSFWPLISTRPPGSDHEELEVFCSRP